MLFHNFSRNSHNSYYFVVQSSRISVIDGLPGEGSLPPLPGEGPPIQMTRLTKVGDHILTRCVQKSVKQHWIRLKFYVCHERCSLTLLKATTFQIFLHIFSRQDVKASAFTPRMSAPTMTLEQYGDQQVTCVSTKFSIASFSYFSQKYVVIHLKLCVV